MSAPLSSPAMASSLHGGNSDVVTNSTTPASIRSCLSCRQKRIRCNREQPCAGCLKHSIACMYPPLERPLRKRRAKNSPGLLNRLQALENSIDRLSAVALAPGEQQAADTTPPPADTEANQENDCPMGHAPHRHTPTARLLVNQNSTRYYNNAFWSKLTDEVGRFPQTMTIDH